MKLGLLIKLLQNEQKLHEDEVDLNFFTADGESHEIEEVRFYTVRDETFIGLNEVEDPD